MSSSHERNDRRGLPSGPEPGADRPRRGFRHGRGGSPAQAPDGLEWLWGRHAVEAALANAERAPSRVIVTAERERTLQVLLSGRTDKGAFRLESADAGEITRTLPAGAVHQGCAMLTAPLGDPGLEAVASAPHGVIVVLDQVTDPQNVGAILRSAAAFGVRAVVLQDRRAPPLAGATAKAAAGAVERVPVVRVVNLARALDRMTDLGWRAVGLASEAAATLDEALDTRPTVIVLGSEGEGLRRLVAEHCDTLARITMPGGFDSLNVSAAAAVALYARTRALGVTPPRSEAR